ncbi:Hypothetical protein LUCI_5009 [Lucifera butyrica]|uniref:HD domain-containing protein n=1 Tax=Lucifera butyrica TaxID=1351585 RepID=A0A498RDZ7_9FIRM|nr:HD domain-containing protein [Lucifera butyrica]VBB09711.1 Hypothetical protein LUCI_5009 [Lucifera butyrica]
MNKQKIKRLTVEYGGQWSYQHVQRVLNLIRLLGEGMNYDAEAVWYAAYLHDWGAFPQFNPDRVELGHEIRSRQVAETMLAGMELPDRSKKIILEAIENHDYRSDNRSQFMEAALLRDADFLDFLGFIGIAREFARGPKDMKECCKQAVARRDGVLNKLTLPRAKEMAAVRLAEMNDFLERLKQESFGYL